MVEANVARGVLQACVVIVTDRYVGNPKVGLRGKEQLGTRGNKKKGKANSQ
jgi:hypothetical protein